MKAKKSLGQHFLKSESALAKITAAANLSSNDAVLEIGPGTGILTARLLAEAGKVLAIEKDRDLIQVLQEAFSSELAQGKLELIDGDILKFDPKTIGAYKLVANIPYYITGAIIEQFLSTENNPSTMVLLIQKEVAERIVARDGKESVLSIAVKAYGKPRIVAKVPAGAFNPPPKVDSAILAIENISRDFFAGIEEKGFFEILKFVFGKKRGQLGGRLKTLYPELPIEEILRSIDLDPKLRPENLSPEDWKRLVQKLLYWQ
jgi:16S rRNA (adenine1518-N6/adenine1519-N6)-dimethyltransferase